jgi:hypothetical protein
MGSSDTGNSRRCSSFGGIRDHEVLVTSQGMLNGLVWSLEYVILGVESTWIYESIN